MQHTTNYNLPQWEATDAIRREDVNGAMAAVDAAIAGAGGCEIEVGIYVGNGAESKLINLGRKPKAVLLECTNGVRGNGGTAGVYGGLALENCPVFNVTLSAVTIVSNGFTVATRSNSGASVHTNDMSTGYCYIAFF